MHHVCRVDAEEDVQDFRPLCPVLDPSEIIVLILCLELAFHRSRHHSGKLLSNKVFFLILLTERTDHLHFLAPHYRSQIRFAAPFYPADKS